MIGEKENAFYLLEKATEMEKKSLIVLLYYFTNFHQANERSQELPGVEGNEALYPKIYFLQTAVASSSVRLNFLTDKRERQFLLEFQKYCLNRPPLHYSEEISTRSPSLLS